MYYRIIPFSGSFDTYGLIYSSDSLLSPWIVVQIPLKDKVILGLIVWEIKKNDISYNPSDVKEIIWELWDFEFLSQNQLKIVDFVSEHYITPIHNALWLYFPKNLFEKIQKWSYVKIKEKEYKYNTSSTSLSPKQEEIYHNICLSEKKKHLIYGVTGSGKTQIYIKIIEENLTKWLQTLLLIPEIILTSQIWERVKHVFGEDVIILHSGVSAAQKSQYWMDIYRGEAKVIIGTRSSLFYPYNNLWTIIIDEEHDESYISDNAPRYHSLDVAEKISELYDVPLVLWSGTPKVTTFYRTLQGEFCLHHLLEKFQ